MLKWWLMIAIMVSLSGCGASHYKTPVSYDGEHKKIVGEVMWNASYSKSYCLDVLHKLFTGWEAAIIKEQSFHGSNRIIASGFDRVCSSCLDATNALIVLAETSPETTKIVISSPNSSLTKFIEKHLQSGLEGK